MSRVPEWTLADRMRKALDLTGMTHREMAAAMGCSQSSVSGWINGVRNPSRSTVEMWARVCDVSPVWLWEGKRR